MKGLTGKTLVVDLTTGKCSTTAANQDDTRLFISPAPHSLYRDLEKGIDPLSEGNELIFWAGALTGTGVLGASRTVVTTKSPLTGGFMHTHAGGYWANELKRAGYDQIIVRGKSKEPVYIWVNDDQVEIRNASSLWGQTIFEATDRIRSELGDETIKVASIGPAGENLVKYANIAFDKWCFAGRGGAGCVAGSKGLKAIAVKGTKTVEVSDPKRVRELNRMLMDRFRKTGKAWEDTGTLLVIDSNYARRSLGGLNYQRSNYTEAFEKLKLEVFRKHYLDRERVNKATCHSCPLHCHGPYLVREGRFAGTKGDKIEYGAVGQLGMQLGILDYGAICHMNNLVNEYGIDYFDLGRSISLIMECRERKLINDDYTGGRKLDWGATDEVIETIKDVVYRRGFGDKLAEGAATVAQDIGGEAFKYAISVKNMTIDCTDARVVKSWALGSAVGHRPDHLQHFEMMCRGADPDFMEKLFGSRACSDYTSHESKGRVLWWSENYKAVADVLGLCVFILTSTGGQTIAGKGVCFNMMLGPETVAQMYAAATGIELNGKELMKCGERIVQLGRLFNVREGFSRDDDTLPYRLLHEPTPDSPEGLTVDLSHPGMLAEYYAYRGYDERGVPLRERLQELGMGEFTPSSEGKQKLTFQEIGSITY